MNLENRMTKPELLKIKNKLKKVLFFRICGTGMGAAACLLKEFGVEIFGTDKDYFPPMSTYLNKKGIPKVSYDEIKFDEYDLIVVGNVVAKSSEEARQIEESGVPFCSFPELIGELILKDKIVIGVSGTHGKTTTTYMLIQMLEKLGVKPGYLIGGVINDRPSSSLGDSDYFVIESDEYDTAYFEKTPKFLHYHIDHLIMTSLEYDHADIYSSIDEIKTVFRQLVKSISGSIIYNNSFSAIDFLTEVSAIKFGDKSTIGPKNSVLVGEGVEFVLGEQKIKTNIFGEHNILNLSAAILVLSELGFEKEKIQLSSENIQLVKRRQEFLGQIDEVRFYDDFAHHPTAMRLTIESFINKFPNEELSVIFEPASATARSNVFQSEFISALDRASRIFIINPLRKTSAIGAENIDVKKITETLNENSERAFFGEERELRRFIQETKHGIVLFMSNGKLLGIKEKLFI